MKMISELFIRQKTWFNFVSFLTEQTLDQTNFVLSYKCQNLLMPFRILITDHCIIYIQLSHLALPDSGKDPKSADVGPVTWKMRWFWLTRFLIWERLQLQCPCHFWTRSNLPEKRSEIWHLWREIDQSLIGIGRIWQKRDS